MTDKARKQIGYWLLVGVVMVFFQIVLGGITRLTESGLSITQWEVVTGVLPPLSEAGWQDEFDQYKQTTQYQKINQDMTLSEFRFIYFWEYVHRLWGRIMGFVFIIPFGIFLYQKKLSALMIRKLLAVILLGALVGGFGWIMVLSGLEDRPWVDAYKLTIHLMLAFLTYAYLVWLTMQQLSSKPDQSSQLKSLWQFSIAVTAILTVQLAVGGLMSGMKAALFYPSFPDMNGQFIPPVLMEASNWSWEAFRHYESQSFAVAFVQFIHRIIAYVMTIAIGVLIYKGFTYRLSTKSNRGFMAIGGLVLLQVILGIVTLLTTEGHIPVLWGVLHQAGAILLLTSSLFLNYHLWPSSTSNA